MATNKTACKILRKFLFAGVAPKYLPRLIADRCSSLIASRYGKGTPPMMEPGQAVGRKKQKTLPTGQNMEHDNSNPFFLPSFAQCIQPSPIVMGGCECQF